MTEIQIKLQQQKANFQQQQQQGATMEAQQKLGLEIEQTQMAFESEMKKRAAAAKDPDPKAVYYWWNTDLSNIITTTETFWKQITAEMDKASLWNKVVFFYWESNYLFHFYLWVLFLVFLLWNKVVVFYWESKYL